MTTIQTPRSTAAAQALLERYATLQDAIALFQAKRNAAISAINADADEVLVPVLAECDAIEQKLQPWWVKASPELTQGKRKSIELGGCLVGTVAGRDSLGVAGVEDDIVKALQKRSWAAPLLRVKVSLDKRAVLKSIDGAYRKQLAALGLSRITGDEKFFVQRAEQAGTIAEVQS